MDYKVSVKRLVAEIEKERDWRVIEFKNIKRMFSTLKVSTNDEGNKIRTTFSTMCIPIIYAHWEGFCVSLFRLIANFINGQKLSYNKITNPLFTYSNKKTYDYLKGKQSFFQRCKFSERFLSSISESEITIDPKYDGRSNFRFEVLSEMLCVFDISIAELKKYEKPIDKLVNIRNQIAHGEGSIVVDESVLVDNTQTVVECIDDIIDIFSEYLQKKKYLR